MIAWPQAEPISAGTGPYVTVALSSETLTLAARGFAFVEMASEEGAQTAMATLNNQDFGGRNLTVNTPVR